VTLLQKTRGKEGIGTIDSKTYGSSIPLRLIDLYTHTLLQKTCGKEGIGSTDSKALNHDPFCVD
jgi:hypothetical protein